MPNGGVFDTCAQCPFYTAAVIGEFVKPFNENSHPEKFCTIREIEIIDDGGSCINHPENNPEVQKFHLKRPDHKLDDLITIPIGPVFAMAYMFPDNNYTVVTEHVHNRGVLIESLDTEKIRLTLIELVGKISKNPITDPNVIRYIELYAGMDWRHIVIWQLGEFKERRAVKALERITKYDPQELNPKPTATSFGTRTREWNENIIIAAKEALNKING